MKEEWREWTWKTTEGWPLDKCKAVAGDPMCHGKNGRQVLLLARLVPVSPVSPYVNGNCVSIGMFESAIQDQPVLHGAGASRVAPFRLTDAQCPLKQSQSSSKLSPHR